MSLLVIVPSRGRPQNVKRQWTEMAPSGLPGMQVHYVVDDDDPALGGYYDLLGTTNIGLHVTRNRGEGMAAALNERATASATEFDVIGFMGDDHLPRTEGWGERIQSAADELGTGIVYGNDLLQGEALPTAVFMTSDIIRTLGYMALPGAKHLFLDNVWRDLGEALGALRYLPDVIIEHLHPIAGKTEWDEGYNRVNAGDMYEHDRAVYEQWRAEGLPRDVARIRDGRVAALG